MPCSSLPGIGKSRSLANRAHELGVRNVMFTCTVGKNQSVIMAAQLLDCDVLPDFHIAEETKARVGCYLRKVILDSLHFWMIRSDAKLPAGVNIKAMGSTHPHKPV